MKQQSNLTPVILVEVRGGNIVGVYATHSDTRVTIVDWDNLDDETNHGAVSNVVLEPIRSVPHETQQLIQASERSHC